MGSDSELSYRQNLGPGHFGVLGFIGALDKATSRWTLGRFISSQILEPSSNKISAWASVPIIEGYSDKCELGEMTMSHD